jgi:hypothetical protein
MRSRQVQGPLLWFNKIFFPKKRFRLKLLLFRQKKDHSIGFKKSANFSQKIGEIAKNSDYNIGHGLVPSYDGLVVEIEAVGDEKVGGGAQDEDEDEDPETFCGSAGLGIQILPTV